MAQKFNINLASEPFQRNRPILAASLLAGVVLIALLGVQIRMIFAERARMAETRDAISKAQEQLLKSGSEQGRLEGSMRQPENAEVLDRSQLLNTLIRRKAISWTRVFADLEKVMPNNVRLISVRPEVTLQNQVSLQMVVGAQSSEPVLALLKNMEESPLFGPTSIQNWLPPSQSDPLYRYRVSVSYAQKL